MSKFLRVLLFLAVLNVTFACQASDTDVKLFKFKNGHTVVIKEVHANPIVTIDTWVKTGSAMENDENNGISHFLEHLMFKGTKNHKNGVIEKTLESKGGRCNAATSKDFTHYYMTAASNYADTAIELHADMMQNPVIPQEEMDKERKVVQEEIRRANDNPKRTLLTNLFEIIFKEHPYRRTTLGPHENIDNLTRDDMLQYFNDRYAPSNLTTIIVGDIDTNEALKLVKKNFTFKKRPTSKISHKQEAEPAKALEIIERGDYKSGYLYMGFKGVPATAIKETYALDMAASILGGSNTSRLYQKLKEDMNLVSSIGSGNYSLKDDSVFLISADFEPEKYQAVKAAITEELEKFRNNLVSDEELKRAKTLAKREYIYGNESVQNISGSLGYSITLTGNLDNYKNHLKYLERVTTADIQKVAKKYLTPERVALSVLLPKETTVNDIKPEIKTIKTSTRSVLPNKTVLITSKNTSNDIISMTVFLKGGTFLEPKPGTASLLNKTLLYGTKNRPYKELIKELEDSGISLVPGSSGDFFTVSLKSTKDDFDKAFEILADVINNPTFEEKYIEKNKENILTQIKKGRDKPLNITVEKFVTTLYKDHPYGHTGYILEENIPKITREDVVNYWSKTFIPENMVVSVAGNIDHNMLSRKLLTAFPSSGKKTPTPQYAKKFTPIAKNTVVKTNYDSKAAWMFMGWATGNNSNDKEVACLRIIDNYLSGGLSSRLHRAFREEQGLAYTVGSSYSPKMDKGHFVLYIGTEPKNIELVENKFLKEIEILKTKPLSEKDLTDTKNKIIGNYALSQETNSSKARLLGKLEIIDKEFGFNYDFPDLINSITAEDVMNVANKYFKHPHILSIVAP